ncbi:S-adenosyl-L-methionine-dependent methyltransferase, partial [Lentinula aciculospora]
MHDRSSVVRALEFYSGIGGLHLALKRSKVPGLIVKAFDWDQNAAKVYDANHGPSLTAKEDISGLSAPFLASFRVEFWILSPACQPYTVLNPDAKGILDPRARSFLHLVQVVLPELVSMGAHPTHFLVENVGGFERSATRQILLSQLRSLGYTTAEFLLSPLQFGIPNSRLRYYLLAKTAPFKFPTCVQPETTYRHIPQCNDQIDDASSAWVDPQVNPEVDLVDVNATEIRHYLDDEDDCYLNPRQYSVPDRVLEKWGRLFDIVLPSSKRTCCFTRGYTQLVERAGSIVQMNTELDASLFSSRLLISSQAAGRKDAVSILHPLRLRYLTPSELLRIFHFNPPSRSSRDEMFFWPDGISNKTRYRLIGNSVNVHVVTELVNFLY